MARVTGHSKSLLQEQLALADKYFPTREALAEYLNDQLDGYLKYITREHEKTEAN